MGVVFFHCTFFFKFYEMFLFVFSAMMIIAAHANYPLVFLSDTPLLLPFQT